MANFTLSTASLAGGGGSVVVTPVSATTFTGRKATGTVTVKNGAATSTVSLTKDYPQTDAITKVTVSGANIPDWRSFDILPQSVPMVITMTSNRPTMIINTDGISATCSVKIGSKWYGANGAESSTLVSFTITEEMTTLTLPNNLGLTSAYTAEISITIPANPKSYGRDIGITVDTDSLNCYQGGATATVNATPTSLSWSITETAGKTVTVTSNGATIPVTVA